MKLVVGLGNPGNDYKGTYHNVGFVAADILSSRLQTPDFTFDKKSNSAVSDCVCFGERTLICKPQTYMNLSGDAVAFLARYFKIDPVDILVMYDDIDVVKGTVRARLSGSAGTHNGMRDIVCKLGAENFARVRIGTGLKPDYMALSDYVLSRYSGEDKNSIFGACGIAADFAEQWLSGIAWQTLTVKV